MRRRWRRCLVRQRFLWRAKSLLAAISRGGQIVARGLAGGAVEERARGGVTALDRKKKDSGPAKLIKRDAASAAIEDAFRKRLQTDVQLMADQDGKGFLKIQFYSHDDLERVLDIVVPGFRDI